MIAAVDIGGTKIAVGIVDENGKVLAKKETPTGAACDYSVGLQRIAELLRSAAQEVAVEITGIGIGSTGPVDPFTGQFGDIDLLPRWRYMNPVADLTDIFKVRVAIENDADAGALAEAGWGAGQGKQRLIYITIGTGIGGGIILDGQLYRGVGGAHPELSHHVMDFSGPPCSCGLRGCWEALATGPAMAAWFKSQLPQESANHGNVSAQEICELARRQDELALRAVQREAYYLGVGIANLINLFTPDAIVLGGSMMKSADLFLEGALAVVRQGCRFVPFEKTEVVLASLGEHVNLIGAARVWRHRFAQKSATGSSH